MQIIRTDVEPQDDPEPEIHDGEHPQLPEAYNKRGVSRRKVDRAAHWVKRQLVELTDVEGVKRSIAGDEGDILRRQLFHIAGRRFLLKFLKWRFSAPYTVRIHYLIVAGDADALKITEAVPPTHSYNWDMEHEIRQEEVGVQPVTVSAGELGAYAVNTLAFKRLRTQVVIDEKQGTEDPIQWGKGMHLLAWNVAVRDIEPGDNVVRAKLDLFYKNWSEAMNEVITMTTWGAVRAAGAAYFDTRLALLQFRSAKGGAQQRLPGRIRWPGGGLSARTNPRASYYRRVSRPAGEKEGQDEQSA